MGKNIGVAQGTSRGKSTLPRLDVRSNIPFIVRTVPLSKDVFCHQNVCNLITKGTTSLLEIPGYMQYVYILYIWKLQD